MPLKGLNRPSARPRGGVAKVELIPASDYDAGSDPATDCGWAFCEDRATYTVLREGALTRHTLIMEFAATADARNAIDRLAAVAAAQGIVARVTLASGQVVVAGYSTRFATTYPLRPTSLTDASGRTPGDMPTISITLESTD
jgi:hypothetical protein